MNREQLIHIVRASAEITNETRFVIVGSQSLLASHDDLPDPLVFSMEADIYPRDDPEMAIKIDGGIGEGSMFQDTFGYYAHGVGPETAKCPTGWEDRLVPLALREGDREIRADCLEPHDLVLSKCVAGRERDWEFARCAVEAKLVDIQILRSRVNDLPVCAVDRARVSRMLAAITPPKLAGP